MIRRRSSSCFALFLTLLAPVLHAEAQPGGQLDSSFDHNGLAVARAGVARAVVVQPDGRIVVASLADNPPVGFAFAVTRLNPNGSLDTTFGAEGVATAAFVRDARAHALFLEPNGKILVAGRTSFQGPNGLEVHLALARFDANGALDPTFGGDGTMTSRLATNLSSPSLEIEFQINAVARHADGSFAVAGRKVVREGSLVDIRFFTARFLAHDTIDAPLDPTFGQAGIATTSPGKNVGAETVLVQPDGRIVVAGTARFEGTYSIVVVRYTVTGQLDSTFGGDGITIAHVAEIDTVNSFRAAALQPDGAILVAGHGQDGGISLARFLPDGSQDASFDGDGAVFTPAGTGGAADLDARAITVQIDGKVIVAGVAQPPGEAEGDFLVIRYHADGALDSTFGIDGLVFTDFDQVAGSTRGDAASAVVLQQDGKILVAGNAEMPGDNGGDESLLALARYHSGRTADMTIAIASSTPVVIPGETFTYTLTVTNHGPDLATNVVVVDRLPASLTFVSCATTMDGMCEEDGGVNGRVRTVRFATIPAAGTRTIAIRVTLSATVPEGTAIANTAAVTSDTTDPDRASNVATTTVAAGAAAGR